MNARLTTRHRRRTISPTRGRGFTLVEVMISMLLVAGIFVAALSTLAAARAGQAHIAQRSLALPLAQQMMAHMLLEPYDSLSSRAAEPVDDLPGWTRAVAVDRPGPDSLMASTGADHGLKRITVTVRRGDAVVVELVTLRAQAHASWQEGAVIP